MVGNKIPTKTALKAEARRPYGNFVQQSRKAEFKDAASLCGKKVGASRRTMFPAQIAAWSEKNCGSNPIQFIGTDGSADARTQLRQGRIDAAAQGNETLPYIWISNPAPMRRGRAHRAAIHRHRPAGQGKGTSAGHSRSGRWVDRRRHLKTLLAKWKLNDNGLEKATINAGQ